MLPPQRVSLGRSKRRRSHHALSPIKAAICPVSGMPKLNHRACAESGYVRPGLTIKVKKLGIGVERD